MAVQKDFLGMTYAEYCLLPDDGKRYQVIEGELIVSPSPNFQHQNAVWNLGEVMRRYARDHDLGVVVGAPMDVILEPNTIVQPDLLFVRHENIGIIGDKIEGAPDLCVEVLSPSTGLNDRYVKSLVYARSGVLEYWIVDPVRESVTVFDLQVGTYVLRTEAADDTVIVSNVLTGFQIPVQAIFS